MRIKQSIYLFSLKKYCFFLAIAGTMISYLAYLTGHPFRSRIGVIGVLILGFVGCLFSALEYQKINRQIAIQMFWIYFVFTALWDLAALSEHSTKTYLFVIVLGLFTLNLSTFFWFFLSIREKDVIKYIIEWGIRNKYLIFLLAIFIVFSIETIDDWLCVDTYSYYAYIQNAKSWDFTFETFRLLQYCAHNCFGYSIFSLIGEYLVPGNGYGVRIIHIIMSCVSIVAFSEILKKLGIDGGNKKENVLITSIFAFAPLFMGLLYEINLDFPTTCFFIWYLYSHISKRRVFEIASTFLLVFSKEVGILLLVGFIIGYTISFIVSFFYEKETWHSRKKEFYYYGTLCFTICFFYLLVFLLSDKWNQEEKSVSISKGGDILFKFGFNIDNIYIKLKEFFVINFSWILVVIFLICLLILLFRKINTKNTIFCKIRLPLLISFVVFFLFNMLYIAHCPARYILPAYSILFIFFAYIVSSALKNKIRYMIYSVIAGLFFIQNFITLDPLTLLAFKNVNIGDGTIITTRTFITDENGEITSDKKLLSNNELANSASYNRQYSYFSSLFEKFLKEISYSENTLIAIAPTYGTYMTKLALFGKWDEGALYYYNPTTEHVVLDDQQSILNIQVIDEDTELDFAAYEKIFLVYFPYREQYYTVESLLEQYEILDTFDVEYRQWLLHAYQIK